MESKLVLYDNYRKNNGSFTYYLEARETFNSFAFGSLAKASAIWHKHRRATGKSCSRCTMFTQTF